MAHFSADYPEPRRQCGGPPRQGLAEQHALFGPARVLPLCRPSLPSSSPQPRLSQGSDQGTRPTNSNKQRLLDCRSSRGERQTAARLPPGPFRPISAACFTGRAVFGGCSSRRGPPICREIAAPQTALHTGRIGQSKLPRPAPANTAPRGRYPDSRTVPCARPRNPHCCDSSSQLSFR